MERYTYPLLGVMSLLFQGMAGWVSLGEPAKAALLALIAGAFGYAGKWMIEAFRTWLTVKMKGKSEE